MSAVASIRNYYDTSMVEQFTELYFCYSGSPAPLCENRVSMDGSTFFIVWHSDEPRGAELKNTIQ